MQYNNQVDRTSSAVELLGMGFLIFPLYAPTVDGGCDCRAGKECSKPGKHPRISRWQEKATSDITTVTDWWKKWPQANIGILTGKRAGLAVIDFDGEAGMQTLQRLQLDLAVWRNTQRAISGRGVHLYFRWPDDGVKSLSGVVPGVDTRGEGGYIIGPGSSHASGQEYRWDDRCTDGRKVLPPGIIKEWRLAVCTQEGHKEEHKRDSRDTQREEIWGSHESQKQRVADFIAETTPSAEGRRHKCLFAFVRRMQTLVPDGEGPDQYRHALREWYDSALAAGKRGGFDIRATFSEVIAEARDGAKRIRIPYSEKHTMTDAVNDCKQMFASGTLPEDLRQLVNQLGYHDDAGMMALMMLCFTLSNLWPESFPLSAQVASDAIQAITGRDWDKGKAGRMIQTLRADGVLECTREVKFGQRGKASEYRWLW